MKNQLSFLKEQKNNYKISEKSLRKKLNLKEKEVNDLRTIINTNISIKSQISSINHDTKEEDNSKEIKEIKPYNEIINENKKYDRPKSLSLIERKLNSYNSSINRRNLLHINNNTNKSNNSKNVSNNKNIKIRKKKKDKNKTISNIFNVSNNKWKNNGSSMKIINNIIRPHYYSNFNSMNSFRKRRLNKSDSRSHASNKRVEESNNSKNILISNNKSINNSNKNLKEKDLGQSNKNKIMINYNTNIINTNVSINKLTIKQKMKDIKKEIDEKINEITRNKRHNIKRIVSAVYDKMKKSPFCNEKIKTKREQFLKYNNNNINDNNKNINSNKLDIKSKKKFKINKYNSNAFIQKLQNFTIQHKNNVNKSRKIKIKFKNNSVHNIKNDEKNKNNEKICVLQGYNGKKTGGHTKLYKNNGGVVKFKKNNSAININQMSSGKNQNLENKNRTINNNNKGLTYRKNNNFNKVFLLNKKIKKPDNSMKNKNNEIYNNNPSIRKYIFNKSSSGLKFD